MKKIHSLVLVVATLLGLSVCNDVIEKDRMRCQDAEMTFLAQSDLATGPFDVYVENNLISEIGLRSIYVDGRGFEDCNDGSCFICFDFPVVRTYQDVLKNALKTKCRLEENASSLTLPLAIVELEANPGPRELPPRFTNHILI